MKTFCKIIACAIAALMLFALVACNQPAKTEAPGTATAATTAAAATTATEASGTEQEEGKPQINERFDGETIKFFVNGGEGGLQMRSIVLGEEDDPDYEVNAKVKERNDLVENELGVTIELTEHKGMQESFGFLQEVQRIHRYHRHFLNAIRFHTSLSNHLRFSTFLQLLIS